MNEEQKKTYYLGNCLRGYFEGTFDSVIYAHKILSARFLKSFPTEKKNGSRSIEIYVREVNHYGYEDVILCYKGETSSQGLSEWESDNLMENAKKSYFIR